MLNILLMLFVVFIKKMAAIFKTVMGTNFEFLHYKVSSFSCFSLLSKKKLHKFELACLANACPETAEEARSLIPR